MTLPRPAATDTPGEAVISVSRLGGLADGIGTHDGAQVYIAGALPGERARVRLSAGAGGTLKGELLEVVEPSNDRQIPPCPHYATCGGCALQHMNAATYEHFKHGLLAESVRRAGYDETLVKPLVRVPVASRRRVEFKLIHTENATQLAYLSAASHTPVPINQCLILTPELQRLTAALPSALLTVPQRGQWLSLSLLETLHGADMIVDVKALPTAAQAQGWTALAQTLGLARISAVVNGKIEPVATLKPVRVVLGDQEVEIPPGLFLQATKEGETAILDILLQHRKGKRLLDLFAGLGTYSLPLAKHAKVHAVEGEELMVAHIKKAARSLPVTAETRDLFSFPLAPQELNGFDTVVINPPRAGAKQQTAMLARSEVPLILMVSCNPATLTRDATMLKNAGYSLISATPIDQFTYSHHLESVLVFKKGRK